MCNGRIPCEGNKTSNNVEIDYFLVLVRHLRTFHLILWIIHAVPTTMQAYGPKYYEGICGNANNVKFREYDTRL